MRVHVPVEGIVVSIQSSEDLIGTAFGLYIV